MEAECAQCLAGRANGVDLAVSSGIECGRHRIYAFADDFAVAHDDRGKRTSAAGVDVLNGKRDSATQKLGIGWHGWGQLAQNLPQRRK